MSFGFAPALKEITADQQDYVADFVLGKGYTLSGKVTDVEGKPLKDAFVSLYVHNWHLPLIPSTRTDETGRFTLNNVPAGEIQLHASKDGYNTAHVQHTVMEDAQNFSLVLTSKSAFQFKIKVVDVQTNQAIPAFEWALVESPGSKNRITSQPKYELRQSADGTLEYFANEAGKIYDVFVRAKGYAPAVVHGVHATPGNEVKTVIVKLQRSIIVEGKVIADAGYGVHRPVHSQTPSRGVRSAAGRISLVPWTNTVVRCFCCCGIPGSNRPNCRCERGQKVV